MDAPNLPEGLRRYLKRRPVPEAGEACDLCREPVSPEHSHVVEVESRRLLCACRPCALLFVPGGAGAGRYRTVPDRCIALGPGPVDEPAWESLQIPVGVAFFFVQSALGRTVAFYPGSAGAAESQLPLDAWREIAERSPEVGALEPDVEALLVRRRSAGDFESFAVPIDVCYELVGRIRRTWKGFDGGDEARDEIAGFFDRLRDRCAAEASGGGER